MAERAQKFILTADGRPFMWWRYKCPVCGWQIDRCFPEDSKPHELAHRHRSKGGFPCNCPLKFDGGGYRVGAADAALINNTRGTRG